MSISRFRASNLTDADIAVIREGHRDGRSASDVAREVGCTVRNVRKYYHRYNGGLDYKPKRGRPKSRAEKKPPVVYRVPSPRGIGFTTPTLSRVDDRGRNSDLEIQPRYSLNTASPENNSIRHVDTYTPTCHIGLSEHGRSTCSTLSMKPLNCCQ